MAPHLSPAELHWLHGLHCAGETVVEAHASLSDRREQAGIPAPDLTTVRRALKQYAQRTSAVETRGRKRKMTDRAVHGMDKARKAMSKAVDGDFEIHWDDLVRKTRARVHRTTAKRSMNRAGLNVAWRRAREKPLRQPEHEAARVDWCLGRRHRRSGYWVDNIDMIIDNKTFVVPTNRAARKYIRKCQVRGHLRLPGEGLQSEFTRPSTRKNRMNTGGRVSVCAGLSNGKVVLWQYLDKTWNGDAAAELYTGPLLRTLRQHRGDKRRYVILEDNDPSGYKSSKGMSAKAAVNISTIDLPAYSADLNPLDYSIWQEINVRMSARAPVGRETMAAFKRRLRRTAMSLPEAVVRKAIGALPKRIQAVVDAEGRSIPCD